MSMDEELPAASLCFLISKMAMTIVSELKECFEEQRVHTNYEIVCD
jgi:hypothetical protein